MPCRAMKPLAKSLELSSCAALRVGPTIASSAARKASTMPAASGASGPTTVKPICSRCANATSAPVSDSGTLVRSGSSAVPPLPGATKTLAARGDCAIFQAIACSRPPEPITSTFTARLSLQIDLAEDVKHAAVVHASIELRDIAREQFELLVAQGGEGQHGGYRPAIGDVLTLDDQRREAEPALQTGPVAPVRGPGIAEVVLRLAVRVLEYQEEHAFGVAVGLLARARQTAAPGQLVFLGAPLGGPVVRKVPFIARYQERVAALGVGIDDVAAPGLDPGPEVGALERVRATGQHEGNRGGEDQSLQRALLSGQ